MKSEKRHRRAALTAFSKTPLPPHSTAKRRGIKKLDTTRLPDSFKPLTAKCVVHDSSSLVVDVSKRMILDPCTSYFISRHNSASIDLFKTRRLAYYFLTKTPHYKPNWVLLTDRQLIRELTVVTNIVNVTVCSQCYEASWEKRSKHHTCDKNVPLYQGRGFLYREDSNSSGCNFLIQLDILDKSDCPEEIKGFAIQLTKLLAESDLVEEEQQWKQQLCNQWSEIITKRRSGAKERYLSTFKQKKEEVRESVERSGWILNIVLGPSMVTLEEGAEATESGETLSVLADVASIDYAEIISSFSDTLNFHITHIISSTPANFEKLVPWDAFAVSDTINGLLSDPIVKHTVLPFLLLDTITDDIWQQPISISGPTRFHIDPLRRRLSIHDDNYVFPLALELCFTEEDLWTVRIILECPPNAKPDDTELGFEAGGATFGDVCQILVVFRALVFTIFSRLKDCIRLGARESKSEFLGHVFRALPCSPEDAAKVIADRLYNHLTKWK